MGSLILKLKCVLWNVLKNYYILFKHRIGYLVFENMAQICNIFCQTTREFFHHNRKEYFIWFLNHFFPWLTYFRLISVNGKFSFSLDMQISPQIKFNKLCNLWSTISSIIYDTFPPCFESFHQFLHFSLRYTVVIIHRCLPSLNSVRFHSRL
jgi:hypothetical protein